MQEMDGCEHSLKSFDVFHMFVQKGIHSNNEAFQNFSSISLSTKIGDLPQKWNLL
jgi:hypothetical protein